MQYMLHVSTIHSPQSNPLDGEEEEINESQGSPTGSTFLGANQSCFFQLGVIPKDSSVRIKLQRIK